jgi:HAMP domain-containing protein
MNTTALQGVIWLVAGGAIYLFLRRRRTRRTQR